MSVLNVREDGSEIVPYTFEGYYAFVGSGKILSFPNAAVDSHWHEEIEFSRVISGRMSYRVNGEEFAVEQGQGVIIQRRQLHWHFSADGSDCEYICVLIHPLLLCATPQIENDLVRPVLENFPAPYIILNGSESWHGEILELLKRVFSHRDEPGAPLLIQSEFYKIWHIMYLSFPRTDAVRSENEHLSILKKMMSFVQHHYAEELSLDDIAKSGNISKSSCLLLFRKYLRESPVQYLISCRLKAAANLLGNTELPVTEITYLAGFSSPSYLAERFRRQYGISPLEYRKRSLEKAPAPSP